MSKLHVNQIEGQIKKLLDGKIDMSDYAPHTDKEVVHKAFLTRGLSVFSIVQLVDANIDELAAHVTDGQDDGGVDLIYYDSKNKTLYLNQSKWHSSGHGSIEKGDILKFIDGVKKILDLDFDDFNGKIRKHESTIRQAVFETNAKMVLVISHTGLENLSSDCTTTIDKYIESVNDTSEIMGYKTLTQKDIYSYVSLGISGGPITIEVQLKEWGQIKEPNKAIYGQVCVTDVAAWVESHGNRLFDDNLRLFKGFTAPNQDIISTLEKTPEKFWYYNNGITAIANSINKKLIGGDTTSIGTFDCQGFCIVNGAQTAGSIHNAVSKSKDSNISKAVVTIRIISIDNDEKDFSSYVTRYTNTQNSIEKSDFVALDPEQERIRQELALEGIDYLYKSGSKAEPTRESFDLMDATLALACSNKDILFPVQAKREIGKLWEDVRKAPYKALFNGSVFGPSLWELVKVFRSIEASLSQESKSFDKKPKLICVHGNRFIEWAVMQSMNLNQENLFNVLKDEIPNITKTMIESIVNQVQDDFPDAYPASLFKNLSKCKTLAVKLELGE